MSLNRFFALPLLALMASPLSAVPATPPQLLFSPEEAGTLRERAEKPEHLPVWEEVQERAAAFSDPGHAYFRDPADVLAIISSGDNLRMRLLRSGRHLAIWSESLGPAALLLENELYARHGAALTVAMAEAWPFEELPETDILAHGEMMRGLALGYDFFNHRMTARERALVADVAAAHIEDFLQQARPDGAWWYPNSNHMAVAGGAAGALAIAIEAARPEEAPGWIERCRELMEIWMESSFDEEGAYSEGASYIEYANVNVALFAHALVRRGGPDLYEHPHIRKSPRYLAMSLLPGTYETEARNSAGFAAHFATPWIKRLAHLHDDGLAAWLWEKRQGRADYPLVQLDHSPTRGRSFFRILWHYEVNAVPPGEVLPLNLHFPGRGLCIWRTGWEREDVMFSIEAGKYYNVTHDQSDEGHFNFYGHGYRWATDPGTGNQWLDDDRSQAIAHSLVFVDGKAQAKSGSGRGTDGRIADYYEDERFSYALADATEAYNRRVAAEERERIPGKGPDSLAAVVRHAHRHAFFIRPTGRALPYAVLIDDIEKDSKERHYTWQMVTDEEMKARFAGGRAILQPAADASGRTPAFHIFIGAGKPLSWDSSLHTFPDKRHPPRIQQIQATTKAVNPLFMTVLLPLPAASSPPRVQIGDGEIVVEWPDRRDEFRWSGHGRRPRVSIR